MIASGVAHSGMVAKLAACRVAIRAGVGRVAIVNGRRTLDFNSAHGTKVVSGRADTVPVAS